MSDAPDPPEAARARPPLYLARRRYRRRRMMDGSLLLSCLGIALFLAPVFWRPAETPAADTAPAMIYLFAVWLALIGAAFLLARGLAPALDEVTSDTDVSDGGT